MGAETILIILVLVCGFYAAWNIGANDVANAMGTSVGSGALSLRTAVILAAIFEFAGAVMVGSNVTETIRSKIFDTGKIAEMFPDTAPYILACGMIAALFASGTWLMFATYMHWPVSTTHSLVGAVIGFACLTVGSAGIKWEEVLLIGGGWIFSPLLAGVVSYLCFGFILRHIFYQPDPVEAAKRVAPWLAAATLAVLTGMVAMKALKPLWKRLEFQTDSLFFLAAVLGVASVLGAVAWFVMKYVVRGYRSSTPEDEDSVGPEVTRSLGKTVKHLQRVRNSASGDLRLRAEQLLKEAEQLEAGAMHRMKSFTENPDLRQVERIFIGLQILTACFVAFAHGANDVSNAIGPMSSAWQAIQLKSVAASSPVPVWTLYLGGVGIISGLAMWGWKVIRTVGEKITELTPSRGYCAEFSASLVILLASILPVGLPVSTTHTLVGAVLGVGLAKGINALNLRVMRDIAAGWIVTIPAGALLSMVFFLLLRLIFIDGNLFDLPKE